MQTLYSLLTWKKSPKTKLEKLVESILTGEKGQKI